MGGTVGGAHSHDSHPCAGQQASVKSPSDKSPEAKAEAVKQLQKAVADARELLPDGDAAELKKAVDEAASKLQVGEVKSTDTKVQSAGAESWPGWTGWNRLDLLL